MPFLVVAGDLKCPSDEFNRVIEAESALTVLNVVLLKQIIQLFHLLIIGNVDSRPLESSRECIWLLLNVFDLFMLNFTLLLLRGSQCAVLWNRLCVPEAMCII